MNAKTVILHLYLSNGFGFFCMRVIKWIYIIWSYMFLPNNSCQQDLFFPRFVTGLQVFIWMKAYILYRNGISMYILVKLLYYENQLILTNTFQHSRKALYCVKAVKMMNSLKLNNYFNHEPFLFLAPGYTLMNRGQS